VVVICESLRDILQGKGGMVVCIDIVLGNRGMKGHRVEIDYAVDAFGLQLLSATTPSAVPHIELAENAA